MGWLVDLSRLKDQGGEPRPLYTLAEVREVFKSDRVRLSREALSFLQGVACSIGLGFCAWLGGSLRWGRSWPFAAMG